MSQTMNARYFISLLIRLIYVAGVVVASMPWWTSGADYARGVCVVGYITSIVILISPRKALVPTVAFSVAMLIFLGIVGLTENPRMGPAGQLAGMSIEGVRYAFPIILIFSPIAVLVSRCVFKERSRHEGSPSEPKKMDASTALLIKILIACLVMAIGLVSFWALLAGLIVAPD